MKEREEDVSSVLSRLRVLKPACPHELLCWSGDGDSNVWGHALALPQSFRVLG